MPQPHSNSAATQREPQGFISRVAIVAAFAALLFLAWKIRHAVILGFGGIVAAVIVLSVADPIRERMGLSRAPSVLLGLAIIVATLALFGWVAMPTVQLQGRELLSRLPDSIAELEETLRPWLPEGEGGSGNLMASLAQRLAAWTGTAFVAVTTWVLVIAAGVFFALRPTSYRDGLVALITPRRQLLLRRALDRAGTRLKAWLRAPIISMVVLGLCVTAATWALGLPAPFALGFIAGLLEFVPIIGPIAAAVPALLLALTISPMMVLWTGLTYFVIEQIESNVILPLAQQEMAELPPALLIFAFVAFGAVFGLAGIILSAPLSVALYSLVNDLYVRPLNIA